MGKVFNSLAQMLLILVIVLVITGGGYLHLGKVKIEIGAIDPWAIGCILVSYLAYKKTKSSPKTLDMLNSFVEKLYNKKAFVYVFSLLFITVFITHLLKHLNFQTNMYDMGYVHQALFYPFESKLLQCDVCKFGSYLSDHISFSLLLIAPITALTKSDSLIFLLQLFFIFIPIALLIKKGPVKDKNFLFAAILFIIFCNRSLRNSLFWDFREDHIAFAFLILSLLALSMRRYTFYFLALIIALFSKEHIGLITSGLAVPILFDKDFIKEKKIRVLLSLSTFILSLGISLLSFKYFFPIYTIQDQSINNVVSRFAEFGNTPSEVILNFLTTPAHWWTVLKRFIEPKALKYLFLVLIPYAFFLRKTLYWLFPIALGLSLNIISPLPNEKMMIFHYDLVWLAIAIFALLLGAKRINLKMEDKKPILIALTIALLFSGRWPLYYIKNLSLDNIRDAIFLNNLQRTGTIAASKKNIAHLTSFPSIRILDYTEHRIDLNSKDCEHPSACYHQATKLILDTEKFYEKKLMNNLSSSEWKKVKASPSGRLLLFMKSGK